MSKILVIAATHGGKLRKATLSAVTFASQLAGKTGGEFSVAVIGNGVAEAAQQVAAFGAKAVYLLDGPGYANYLAGPWARTIADLAAQVGADAVAATSDTFSRDVLPRVAARMNAGMVSEVVAIVGDGAAVKFQRPMWAGNVVATVEVKTPKAVFCVRGTEFAQAQPTGSASPVQAVAIAAQDDGRARYVKFEATVSTRPDLGEAQCVVAGGRGLKKEEFFPILDPLADLMKAAIGGTRAVVDAGYCPNDLQIGQTGKVVAPNLYFAIGLSGAIQHIAGMKNSKVIVAINKDAEAPIFSVADYGLVADATKAVPELVEEIKKARA